MPKSKNNLYLINKEAIQEFILKISDQMFSKALTASELLKDFIIDKTLDGKEYQVIKRYQLLEALRKERIEITYKDRLAIKELLIPLWKDYIDVTHFEKILSKLGIKEDIPQSTKFLSFDKLTVPAVRVFNRIINYIQNQQAVSSVRDLLKDKIQIKTVVSKDKEFTVETISTQEFEAVLKDKKILKRHEEVPEEFNDFIELSPNAEDIIMVK